jgi:hypothetical protein
MPVPMTVKEVQEAKQANMLPWTSADRVPFEYEQISKCQGKQQSALEPWGFNVGPVLRGRPFSVAGMSFPSTVRAAGRE